MVAGIEDHRHINMKKERVRGGITGTLAPISPPPTENREGVIH